MVAAVRGRELGLGRRADGADYRRAEMFGPLARDEHDTPRRRMEQDRLTGFHDIGTAQEVLRRAAFEHHGRPLLVADAVRQAYQHPRLNQPPFGIPADGHAVGHPIADADLPDALADGLDHAGAFHAEHDR